jgi:hypothetical protein
VRESADRSVSGSAIAIFCRRSSPRRACIIGRGIVGGGIGERGRRPRRRTRCDGGTEERRAAHLQAAPADAKRSPARCCSRRRCPAMKPRPPRPAIGRKTTKQ